MRRTLLLFSLLAVGTAYADDSAPLPMPKTEGASLDAFAEAHKDCREWTDSCAVCARRPDGTYGCSLPGIACQPQALACRSPDDAKKP